MKEPTNRSHPRFDMVVGLEIEILGGQCLGLFSNEPFEKRPVMTISDCHFHSNDHFETDLCGDGLLQPRVKMSGFSKTPAIYISNTEMPFPKVHIHGQIHKHARTHTHTHAHTRTQTHTHTHTRRHTHTHTQTHTHTHKHTHTHTHTHTRTHTYNYTHKHTHTHAYHFSLPVISSLPPSLPSCSPPSLSSSLPLSLPPSLPL